MIDVSSVLESIPTFTRYCSVAELHTLAARLRDESPGLFQVAVAGTSDSGLPIHHIRCGNGPVRALIIGFPHPNEPIGGLTVYSLLMLLSQGNHELLSAGVEWHIVPCVDPDGALLNEGWSQTTFALSNYMRNFHRQEPRDQVECSFPIVHKRLTFDDPTKEASVLQRLLTDIRPDFYFSLHNAWTGGAFYCLSRGIDQKYYGQLYALLDRHGISLQTNPPYCEWLDKFSPGITEIFSMKKFYDFLEQTTPHPETLLRSGGCSWEYLSEIKEDAIAFLMELSYVKHPSDGSNRPTNLPWRQAKLLADADAKFMATVILEEWENVKDHLDSASPFYKKIFGGLISVKDQLHEGLPSWPFKSRDLLFNPNYGRAMTEGERFNVYLMHRFWLLCHSYEFVRLLKESEQTPPIEQAVARLELLFDAALKEIARNVDLTKFETVDYDALAKVQLGSGLIVLNAILESKAARRAA